MTSTKSSIANNDLTSSIRLITNSGLQETISFTTNSDYLTANTDVPLASRPSVSTTVTLSPTRTNEITSQTSQAQQSAGGGLDTGAAAGIGVGATLGVVALIVVLILIWRRHRKASGKMRVGPDEVEKEGDGASVSTGPVYDIGRVEAPNTSSKRVEAPNTPSTAEAEDSSIAELDGEGRAAEMDGGRKAAELDIKV